MRLRMWLFVLSLLVAACGGGTVEPVPTTKVPLDVTSTTVVEDIQTATTEPEPPVWDGFESTSHVPDGLTAIAHGPLDVYDTPEASDPTTTLEATTILGTITVLGVVAGPEDGRVKVMLPVRPNGSTGWVATDHLSFYVADGKIVVDLSDRRLTYLVDGVEVLTTEVGIGSKHNPTPTGHFFVTDNVTLANSNSPWGPHALGLSAHSTTITEFNGGDGIIGIHGTNNPASIGDNISLGCIRLPNEMIAALHEMVPIGTRVEIRT